jgi:hypothetical protein
MISSTKVNHMIIPISPNHFDVLSCHLILVDLVHILQIQIEYLSNDVLYSIYCYPLALVVLRYITPWLICLEPFKSIIIFEPPSHPKLV